MCKVRTLSCIQSEHQLPHRYLSRMLKGSQWAALSLPPKEPAETEECEGLQAHMFKQ